MTNYNERLDELLLTTLREMSRELEAYGYLDSKNYLPEKREAITSLIKELVVEAKPKDYTPEGHHPDACLNHKEYTSSCCGCQKQRARLRAIDEFKQNLLKELEEV